MARLRVLSSLTYYAPHISGLTVYARRLLGGLARRGHATTVVTSRFAPALPRREIVEGVSVVRTRALLKVSKGVLIPFYPFRIAQQIHHHDVLLLHLPQLEACLAALYARLVARRPVVTVCHCDIELPPGLIRLLATPLIRASHLVTGLLSQVIVVNSLDYAAGSRYLRRFRRKLVASPPPCLLPEADSPPDPPGRSSGRPVIGFVGRFAFEKGIGYLLEAMPAILREAPEARVVFVGEWANVLGEQVHRALRDRIEALGGHVTLTGAVDDAELARWYRTFDVLVLPSVNSTESFGMVQVEAMLAGTPVVATDIPGVREAVRATGMGELIPPRDPGAIARAVLRVVADRQRYVRSRGEIESLFGVERSVRFFERLLEAQCAALRHRRGGREPESRAPGDSGAPEPPGVS